LHILLVSVSWYVGSISPYCSAFPTNVFDMTSQRFSVPLSSHCFSVQWHAHMRLTVRVIRHNLTETEKRGVNYIAPGNLP